MKKRRTNLSFKKTAGGVCIFLALLFSGCADDKKPAHASGQSAHAAMAKSTQTGIPVATAQIRKSVFVLDQASRDPFFPQAKKAVENSPAAVAQVTPMDIPTLLSAGLQGIGGTREHRIAIIYNILLEPGRKVV